MPSRVIRDGLLDSPRWHSVSTEARCFFIALLLLADDFGLTILTPLYIGRHAFDRRPSDTKLALPAVSTIMALQQSLAAFSHHALEGYEDQEPVAQFMALRRLANSMGDALYTVEQWLASAQQSQSSGQES